MNILQIEIAIRNATPLKLDGSALRWTAEAYVADAFGNTKLRLRARCNPARVRLAGPFEIAVA